MATIVMWRSDAAASTDFNVGQNDSDQNNPSHGWIDARRVPEPRASGAGPP